MAKLKIELPEYFPFTAVLPIRITDINYGGHLGNEAVLVLAQEARVQFLATLDSSEIDVGGPGLIMTNAQIVFAAEGHYGMTLDIRIAVTDISALGFDLGYLILDHDSGKEVARILSTQVCFDYQRRRPVRLPDDFRQKLEA